MQPDHEPIPSHSLSPEQAKRRANMRLLALAKRDELAAPLATHWPDLDFRALRLPETGLVMLRGRMGGDGAPFNLGEASVSRAVIELPSGVRGYGQVLGRDREHSHMAAIFDALGQTAEAADLVDTHVLAPIRARIQAESAQKQAQTAATRVDFFTLVRGED